MARQPANRSKSRKSAAKSRASQPKDTLDTAFVDALSSDFSRYGDAAIAALRQDDPTAYLKLCASVLPKAVAGAIDPIEAMTDEELIERAKTLAAELDLGAASRPRRAARKKKPEQA